MTEQPATQEEQTSSFDLVYPDGQTYTVTRDQLFDMLGKATRLQESTISVKEGRQHAAFNPSDRFISMNLDFRGGWALVEMAQGNPSMHAAAIKLQKTAIQKQIMETEDWLFIMAGMMLSKNNLEPFWRNPENPYVKAGWDIQAAFNMSLARG